MQLLGYFFLLQVPVLNKDSNRLDSVYKSFNLHIVKVIRIAVVFSHNIMYLFPKNQNSNSTEF